MYENRYNKQKYYLKEGLNQFISEANQLGLYLKEMGIGDARVANNKFSKYDTSHGTSRSTIPQIPTLDPWEIIKRWLLRWWNWLKQLVMA